jgi:amino acid permease
MATTLTCPSCNVGGSQQIGDIVRQQAAKGSPSGLAVQYNPPKQPWAYLLGFLLAVPINTGLMLSMTSPQSSEASTAMADVISSVAFLGVWVGYGVWRNKAYSQKLDEWTKTIALKFSCHGCGHVFDR